MQLYMYTRPVPVYDTIINNSRRCYYFTCVLVTVNSSESVAGLNLLSVQKSKKLCCCCCCCCCVPSVDEINVNR